MLEVRGPQVKRWAIVINCITVSTGIRFTTSPDATPLSFQLPSTGSSLSGLAAPSAPSQPPTTITALFNPLLGHMSGAYAARVHQDLSLCSRFDFNVYSYESEWTMGAEWWIRQNWAKLAESSPRSHTTNPSSTPASNDIQGVIKARASTSNVGLHATMNRCFLISCSGRLPHVGGPCSKPHGQCRRCFQLIKPSQAYQGYGLGDIVFQFGVVDYNNVIRRIMYMKRNNKDATQSKD